MWIEKIERRDKKSKTFYDEETKKYKTEFTIHDRHFKNDNNQWEDVDETLTDDTGGFNKKCDKTNHTFKIASGGNRRWYPRRNIQTEYVDITGIQYYSNQWRNINLPAAVWKSNGAEWDLPDLYASITNTWKRIKTDFILKNSNAYTRLRFQVAFTGLSYNDTTGELTSTTDGLVWGYIDKPTAVDANGAEITVTQTYAGGYIEWSVDTTGATFPIYVDPTFTDGYGGDVSTYKDTRLLSTQATRNYGVNVSIVSLSYSRGLIEFDLSSIAATATCTSATIYLYQFGSGAAQAFTHTIYSIGVDNKDWIEGASDNTTAAAGEPCWNALAADGAGGVTTAWHGTAGLATSGEDYEADALGSYNGDQSDANGTEYSTTLTASRVEDWFGAINTNYGLKITPNANSGTIASSDHATTAYRPKLVVEYTESGTSVIGSSVWGYAEGAQEGNIRTFSGNWTGTGVISGSGNSEKILLSSGNYMQSEVINTGVNSVRLLQNKYTEGDSGLLKYRSGSSVEDCGIAEWQTYSGSFTSLGYSQVRVEPI